MSFLSTFAQSSYYSESTEAYLTASSTDGEAEAFAVLALVIISFFAAIAAYVVGAFLLMRIFKKAGVSTGAAWIPIYNNWKFLEIGGQKGLWGALLVVPIVNFVSMVYLYIAAYNINKKLGQSDGFYVLFILFPVVWYAILGFNNSTWDDSKGKPSLDPRAQGASVNNYQQAYAQPYPQQPYAQQPYTQQPPQPFGPDNTPPTPPLS